jgi:hypothetical protein
VVQKRYWKRQRKKKEKKTIRNKNDRKTKTKEIFNTILSIKAKI